MSSTFSDDSAVRLADTVQPAALNDLSLAVLDMLERQTVAAPMPAAVETALFLPPGEHILIRKHSTLQVAGDFIRVYRSGVITKHMALFGRNKLGKPQNINDYLKNVCLQKFGPARQTFGRADGPPGPCRPLAWCSVVV